METYATIDGRFLDLTHLTDVERAYLDRCVGEYRDGIDAATFNNRFVAGLEHPLLRETNGWITRQVWDHPLYQAVRDLGARLGIIQGHLAPEGDFETDPIADQWLSTSEAARQKGVSVSALHKAIERGDLIARPAKPGGSWLVVSANSLARWAPNPVRQAAGRRAAIAR